jgi:hypothetical protein
LYCSLVALPEVEVGRNGSTQPELFVEGNESADTLDPQGDGKRISCFKPELVLPSVFEEFCNNVVNPQAMQEIVRVVCEEGRIIHLWLAECGWDGKELSERERYFRTLLRTPKEDKGEWLHYIGTYSLSFADTGSIDSFMDLMMEAHGNTAAFLSKYHLPESTKITPVSYQRSNTNPYAPYTISVLSNDLEITYTGEIFGSRNKGQEIMQCFIYESKAMNNISTASSVVFSGRLDDGTYKVVVLENRVIKDMQLHEVAWLAVRKSDLDRMKLYNDYTKKIIIQLIQRT